jgi:calcineurin-like phosphoesterase family protein
MSKIFYIADLHFGHKNILSYDNRPFFSVSEMDKALIENWNKTVSKDDTVFILGDISWYNQKEQNNITKQLNGTKILIYGNHDYKSWSKAESGIEYATDYAEIKDNNRHVVLSHYPIMSYNGMYRGWYHLYGHVHCTADDKMTEHYFKQWKEYYLKPCLAANVGCMKPWMNYVPRTLDEIISAKGWE